MNKIFSILFVMLVLCSCSSVDEGKFKDYMVNSGSMVLGANSSISGIVIDRIKTFKGYDPVLDDNDKVFSIWYNTKYSKSVAVNQDHFEYWVDVFEAEEPNCDVVVAEYHIGDDTDKKDVFVAFMRDNEYYRCVDDDFAGAVVSRQIILERMGIY